VFVRRPFLYAAQRHTSFILVASCRTVCTHSRFTVAMVCQSILVACRRSGPALAVLAMAWAAEQFSFHQRGLLGLGMGFGLRVDWLARCMALSKMLAASWALERRGASGSDPVSLSRGAWCLGESSPIGPLKWPRLGSAPSRVALPIDKTVAASSAPISRRKALIQLSHSSLSAWYPAGRGCGR
jgi:hypothetical protein